MSDGPGGFIANVVLLVTIGAGAGWMMSYLLRGRGTTSRLVLGGGVIGAALGAVFRQAVGPDGLILWLVTALAGAMLASFVIRLRQFAGEP